MLLELLFGSLLFSPEASRVAEGYESTCGGRPAVYFRMLDTPLVRAELNLTAQQHTAITTLHGDYARRTIAARQKAVVAERDPSLARDARDTLPSRLFDLDQSVRASLESILSDTQETRLTQIFRQLLGPELYKHDNYLAPIRLSSAQSAAATTTLNEYRYKMERALAIRRQEHGRGELDARQEQASRETYARRQREFEDAALQSLYADLEIAQQAQLQQLLGKPLDRHELRRQTQAAAASR